MKRIVIMHVSIIQVVKKFKNYMFLYTFIFLFIFYVIITQVIIDCDYDHGADMQYSCMYDK